MTAAEGLCTRCVADNTASCVLTETSPGYDCTCLDGYAGTRCQYDLCADKCNDDGTATCTKSPGDATCNCNDGWTGEGCSIDLCTKVRALSFVRNSIYCFSPWDNLINLYSIPLLCIYIQNALNKTAHTSSVTIRAPPPVPRALATLLVTVPTTTEASTVRLISAPVAMMPAPQAALEALMNGIATVR